MKQLALALAILVDMNLSCRDTLDAELYQERRLVAPICDAFIMSYIKFGDDSWYTDVPYLMRLCDVKRKG